jgi:hypothetical protein
MKAISYVEIWRSLCEFNGLGFCGGGQFFWDAPVSSSKQHL